MNALLKSLGYLLSELSIVLLAMSAWTGASGNPTMRIAVGVGAVLAAAGMAMRWAAYWRKHEKKKHRHEEMPTP